jgi:hypothetical protein
MQSNAPRSPHARRVAGIEEKIRRLEAFEGWGSPRKIDFEEVLGTELWAQHWDNWDAVIGELRRAQQFAKRLQSQVAAYVSNQLETVPPGART